MKKYKGKKIGRKLFLIATLVFAITAIGKAKANNRQQYITYVVQQGDTVWSIAADNNIYKDIREMVYEIRKINNNNDCLIFPGQELLIPSK